MNVVGKTQAMIGKRRKRTQIFFAAALCVFSIFDCMPTIAAVSIGERIGVGTMSPATEIQVVGTVTATAFSGDGSGLTGVATTGLLPLTAKGTVNSNFTLDLNKVDTASVTASITISLPTSGFVSGYENKCVLDFSLDIGYTLTPPSGVKWANGTAPTYSTLSGVRNILIFTTRDGGTTWEGEYSARGGVETAFVQPTLSSNGTLGGGSFAVYASSYYSASYDAYKAADNDAGTQWVSAVTSGFYYIWYNPTALKVTSISMTNRPSEGYNITGYTLYGSNDNSNWTALVTGTNSVSGASATWSVDVPSANRGYYTYYKLYVSSGNIEPGLIQATLTATYIAS